MARKLVFFKNPRAWMGWSVSIDTYDRDEIDGMIDSHSAGISIPGDNNDIIQKKNNSWVSRTIAQLKIDLGLAKFSNTFTKDTASDVFAWADNTLAISHGLSKQIVDVKILDGDGLQVGFTPVYSSTSVVTIAFPLAKIPIVGTYSIEVK